MSESDLFAYLAAFVTIVLAVALTDLIQSTHQLLRARNKVKWDVLTPLLALYVLLGLLSTFFSLWGDARFERLSYFGLLGFMAQPVLLALLAYAVLPDEVPEGGIDLRQFYFDNRRYVVIILAISAVTDWAWVVRWASMNDAFGNSDFWWEFLPHTTVQVAMLAVMYLAKSWHLQLAALIVKMAFALYLFGGWYITAQPAA